MTQEIDLSTVSDDEIYDEYHERELKHLYTYDDFANKRDNDLIEECESHGIGNFTELEQYKKIVDYLHDNFSASKFLHEIKSLIKELSGKTMRCDV